MRWQVDPNADDSPKAFVERGADILDAAAPPAGQTVVIAKSLGHVSCAVGRPACLPRGVADIVAHRRRRTHSACRVAQGTQSLVEQVIVTGMGTSQVRSAAAPLRSSGRAAH
jgi:hypothetical protein